jgi:hypothetical protein
MQLAYISVTASKNEIFQMYVIRVVFVHDLWLAAVCLRISSIERTCVYVHALPRVHVGNLTVHVHAPPSPKNDKSLV